MDLPATEASSSAPLVSSDAVSTSAPAPPEARTERTAEASSSTLLPPSSLPPSDSIFQGPARPETYIRQPSLHPSPPSIPFRSYPPASRGPSPIPKFLKTLVFILSVLLGGSAVATWVYSRLLLPRIFKSREARQVLVQDQMMRIEKLQEEVDRLGAVGLLPAPRRRREARIVKEGEASEDVETEHEKEKEQREEFPVEKTPHAEGILPSEALRDLSAHLPSLAPKPRPITLTQTLRAFSSQLTGQALVFSSKTIRSGGGIGGGAGLTSLGDKLGGGAGGAWGGSGLSEGDREVIGLIGGLRGDVKGLKGLLLSRRTFASSSPSSSNPKTAQFGIQSSRSSLPQGVPAARWTPPPIKTPSSSGGASTSDSSDSR